MTALTNSVQLIGRAGNDPEVKTVGKDRSMLRFSLATSEYYYNEKGQRIETTQWHRVVAWGKLAERMGKQLKKGQMVAINGKLVNNQWKDKDGSMRNLVEIVANEFMPA
ncbi:MAG TPA: single-stranded DNA-binding protein [Bacteroidales bacterium]|nr:single-stranded DNA-binding protein [Bacteroidales bacterium]